MDRICAWCGIEMWWWRQLTLRTHCRRCAQDTPSYLRPPLGFHTRIGMKEYSRWMTKGN